MFDLFRARVCFAGHITFDLNILKMLGVEDQTQKLLDDFAEIVDLVKNKLFAGFKKLWDWIKNLFGKNPAKEMVEGIGKIPAATKDSDATHAAVQPAVHAAPQLTAMQLVMRAVKRATSMYKNAKRDVMTLYYRIFNAVVVDLPWVFKQIGRVAKLARDALTSIVKNPVHAIQFAAEAVRGFTSAVSVAKNAIGQIKDAFFWENGTPMWMDFDNWEDVFDDLGATYQKLLGRHKRLRKDDSAPAQQEASILGSTLEALKLFLSADGDGKGKAFGIFGKIFNWLVKPFKTIVDLIRTPFEIFKLAKEGFAQAKELLGRTFGPKLSVAFTGGIRACFGKCECGTYPSTGGDNKYEGGVGLYGVDMQSKTGKVEVGGDIVAPAGGVLLSVSKDSVTIAPASHAFSDYELILRNVRSTMKRGDEVSAGQVIGKVADAEGNGCGKNTFHFAMRIKAKEESETQQGEEFINPTQYLTLPDSPGGKWIYECDDYKFIFKGKPIKMGTITGGRVDTNSSGPLLFPPDEEYHPEFGGVIIDDPLGCGDHWWCELQAKSTPMTVADHNNWNNGKSGGGEYYQNGKDPNNGGRSRRGVQRSRRDQALVDTFEVLTIYGNHSFPTVYGAACTEAGLSDEDCSTLAGSLHRGFGFADAPCDGAHEDQVELCLHTACASLGKHCLDTMDASRPYINHLLRDGVSLRLVGDLAKSSHRFSPERDTKAYKYMVGDEQYVHALAPKTPSTTGGVVDAIVSYAGETYAKSASTFNLTTDDQPSLFHAGKLIHLIASANSKAHVMRKPDNTVLHFHTFDCMLEARHSMTAAAHALAVQQSAHVFGLLKAGKPRAVLEQFVRDEVLPVADGAAANPTGRSKQGDCLAPMSIEEVIFPDAELYPLDAKVVNVVDVPAFVADSASGNSSRSTTDHENPFERTTRSRKHRGRRASWDREVATTITDQIRDITKAACVESGVDNYYCDAGTSPFWNLFSLQSYGKFANSRYTALLHGVYSPLFAGTYSKNAPSRFSNVYNVASKGFNEKENDGQQHMSAMANYPQNKEIRCDESTGNFVIGPKDDVNYNEGLQEALGAKAMKASADSGVKFGLYEDSFKSWSGHADNKLSQIRGRMIAQAGSWYGEAFSALLFDKCQENIGSFKVGQFGKKFKCKQMAWKAVGKIAFMIGSSFRLSHVKRSNGGIGNVEMFYSAHCMNPDLRKSWEDKEVGNTAINNHIQGLIKKMLNNFNAHFVSSFDDSFPLRSGILLKQAVEWITTFFHNDVLPMSPTYGSYVAGLFPSCSPPAIAVKDFGSQLSSSGWETVKCTLTRATVATLNWGGYYKANRCEIWKNVVGIAGEGIMVALFVLMRSNPITGLVLAAGRASSSTVGRYFAKYLLKAVAEAANPLRQLGKAVVEEKVMEVVEEKLAGFAASMSVLITKYVFNLFQQDTSVLYEPDWIACLKEYIGFGLMIILQVVWAGVMKDAGALFVDVFKCLILKAAGCEQDKSSCWTLGAISAQCLPGGTKGMSKSQSREASRLRLQEGMKPVYAQIVSVIMNGNADNAIDVQPVEAVNNAALASTCYTKCQADRVTVKVPGTLSGTALRCVDNNVAGLDSDFEIQVYLKCNGMYRTGPLDGGMNDQVVAAVVAFQECFDIVADGIVGPKTQSKMRSVDSKKLSVCADEYQTDRRARSTEIARVRRQEKGYSCGKNNKFTLEGLADYQRWLVCNGFLPDHQMDGVPDKQTTQGVRAFQHHICMSPVDGVVDAAVIAKMKSWKPGKPDKNCRSTGYSVGEAEEEEPEYECMKPNSKHPLNSVLEHKIFFMCNNIGTKQKLGKKFGNELDAAYHETVKAFQKLVKIPGTGLVDYETKHKMWAFGETDKDTKESNPSTQTLGDKILNKLPTKLWKFEGSWQWEVKGGGSGDNPYYSADNDVVMKMTFGDTREMLLKATKPNDDGESFIAPDDGVFAQMNELETKLDKAFKATECAIIGEPDASRLRAVALGRGLAVDGTVDELEQRLAKDHAEKQGGACSDLHMAIRSKTKNCCRVMPMCMGVSCHVPINYIFASKIVKVEVKGVGIADPETGECDAGPGNFKIVASIEIDDAGDDDDNVDLYKEIEITAGEKGLQIASISLDKIKLLSKFQLDLRIEQVGGTEGGKKGKGDAPTGASLDVRVTLSDKTSGKIVHDQVIYKGLPFDFKAMCDGSRTKVPSDIEAMTLSMVDTQLIAHGLYPYTTDLAQIRATVRDVILANFKGMIHGANIAGTEFTEPFDLCLPGRFQLPAIREEFWDWTISEVMGAPIQIGPIAIDGGIGIGGGVGSFLEVTLCIFSLKGTVWIQPWAGAEGYLWAAVVLGPLQAGLRLVATILETSLPTFATTTFTKWPLDICHGSNMKCIPLQASLEIFLRIRLCIWGKCWSKTLISAVVWKWSTGSIDKELWRNCEKEMDPTRPNFGRPTFLPSTSKRYQPLGDLVDKHAPVKNCRIADWEKSCSTGDGKVKWPRANEPPMFQPKMQCWVGNQRCEDVRNSEFEAAPEISPGWTDPQPDDPPLDEASKAKLDGCEVKQLRKRAPDQPAVKLTINTVYPEAESKVVEILYSVGTYEGGTDVAKDQPILTKSSGGSEVFSFELPHWASKSIGMPLFFSATLKNDAGDDGTVLCTLPSYDVTDPYIEIDDVYPLSSHSSMMKFSYTVIDDSELTLLQYAIGTGPRRQDILPWTGIENLAFMPNATNDDPKPIHFFSEAIEGRLVYFPVNDETWDEVGEAGGDGGADEAGGDGGADEVDGGADGGDGGDGGADDAAPAEEEEDPLVLAERVEGPLEVLKGVTLDQCAKQCVDVVAGLGCHSFDYSEKYQECKLHRITHAPTHQESARLMVVHDYKFYIREATINVHEEYGTVEVNDLSLSHSGVYYFTMRARNRLGYQYYAESAPMSVDLRPPKTGKVRNALLKTILADVCHASQFQRCYQPTLKENHAFQIDGPRSIAVLNGVNPLVDTRYSRSNTYFPVHFNGWKDPECGLYKMVFGIGSNACETDIYPYEDPHAHHFGEEDWTHQGIAYPIELPDGEYFATVQGLNKAVFGGSLVSTVCHTTPLIIDTTPPLVHSVDNVAYNDVKGIIKAGYNISDPESHIRAIRLALGRSRHDALFLKWQGLCIGEKLALDHPDRLRYRQECATTYKEDDSQLLRRLKYTLPEELDLEEGVYVWVRIASLNNVGLLSIYPGANVFMIDRSPPEAGELNDGRYQGHDMYFESTRDGQACINWDGFVDPQSGIDRYEWCIGTSTDNNKVRCNAVGNQRASGKVFSACAGDVDLTHKTKYYATIWAVNHAHIPLRTMVHSNGVRIDKTPPTAGVVTDGDDHDNDLEFTDEGHVITSIWKDFKDPESRVVEYYVSVGSVDDPDALYLETAVHCGDGSGFFAHEKPVRCDITDFERHDFNIEHGFTYKVTIRAMNGAHDSTVVASSGVTVDLTPPQLSHVNIGTDISRSLKYFKSKSEFSANWLFTDPESGIDHYEWKIYEVTAPNVYTQVYPKDGSSWKQAGKDESATAKQLSLSSGKLYLAEVVAINGASRHAGFKTNSAMLDANKPNVHDVTVGTQNTMESAELVDGEFVEIADDADGIPAHWTATDDASGIIEYKVSLRLGTAVVSTTTIPLELENNPDHHLDTVRNDQSNAFVPVANLVEGKVYVMCVVAVDGAGWESDAKCSHKIRVVQADVIGEVLEGAVAGKDLDTQSGLSVLSLNWHSFASARCGIVSYDFAVGYGPYGIELRDFNDYGVVVNDDGAGMAQVALPLAGGDLVFVSLRAETGCGNFLEATSDGILIDNTGPVVKSVTLGLAAAADVRDRRIPEYQLDKSAVDGSWDVSDPESPIKSITLQLGSAPGLGDVEAAWTADSTDTDFQAKILAKALTGGRSTYLSVVGENTVGIEATPVSSNSLVSDDTPPEIGTVSCPSGVQTGEPLTCTWTGFADKESSIVSYTVAVSAGLGAQENILVEEVVDAQVGTFTFRSANVHVPALADLDGVNSEYVFTITAKNGVDMTSSATKAIMVDNSPPTIGSVTILSESATLSSKGRRDEEQPACQLSRAQVSVAWEGFADNESSIVSFRVGVGSTRGGTGVKALMAVGDIDEIVITDFDRTVLPGETLYVLVEATNGAGLKSTAISDGLPMASPMHEATVFDGMAAGDLEWQDSQTTINVHWEFNNPCPIVSYEWAVYSFRGKVLQDMEKVCTMLPDVDTGKQVCRSGSDLQFQGASNDNLQLEDGELYYAVVKATDSLGHVRFAQSDGVRVDTELLRPGVVYDGDKWFADKSVQASPYFLASSWDSFGANDAGISLDRIKDFSVEFGDSNDPTDPTSQICINFPKTARCQDGYRGNVVRPQSVGMDDKVKVEDLRLTPRAVTYFSTVTSLSVVDSTVSGSSNGIVIGYGLPIIPGRVSAPPFQTELNEIEAGFEGFATPESTGGMFYEVAIGSQVRQSTFNSELDFSVMDYTCICLGAFRCPGFDTCIEGTFAGTGQRLVQTVNDIEYVSSEGTIGLQLEGLDLGTGGRYFVSVRATNEAGVSNTAQSNPIVIDLTPPVSGSLDVVGAEGKPVAYVPSSETFSMTWDGWHDPESGIEDFGIAIVEGNPEECSPTPDPDTLTLVANNETSHQFSELTLDGNKSYFVIFVARNRVGMATRNVSVPIYFDYAEPESGIVRTGLTRYQEKPYATSMDALQGNLLQVLAADRLECPTDVSEFIVDRGYGRDIVYPSGWKTSFDMQVRGSMVYDETNIDSSRAGLGIALKRDIRKERMTSGAAIAESGLYAGSVHEFDLTLGGTKEAVTSILFIDQGQQQVTAAKSLDDLRLVGLDKDFFRMGPPVLADQDFATNGESPTSKYTDMTGGTRGDGNTTFGADIPEVELDVVEAVTGEAADEGNASFGIRLGIRNSFGLQLHSRSTAEECGAIRNLTQCRGFCRAAEDASQAELDGAVESLSCLPVSTVLLWARFKDDEKEPDYLWLDLSFDASEGSHKFSLVYDKAQGAGLPVWTLTLKVDGKAVGELVNVPELPYGAQSSLILHRQFAGMTIPEVDTQNPLDAWSDVTHFEKISVSLVTSPRACQHDVAWHHWSSPVTWEVAVGTYINGNDVADYQEIDASIGSSYMSWMDKNGKDMVTKQDRPCLNQCDGTVEEDPSGSCALADGVDAAELRSVVFEVTDLNLKLGNWVDPDPELLTVTDSAMSLGISQEQFDMLVNGTKGFDIQGNPITGMPDKMFKPSIYYLSVRAVTASGKTAYSTSEGIMMDATPPQFAPGYNATCKKVDDVDANKADAEAGRYHDAADKCGKEPEMFNPDNMFVVLGQPLGLPSVWQSSTTALAAQWLAVDEESGVAEYRWTLGDRTAQSNILPWTSVGTNSSAVEHDLALQHLGYYCVAVRAYNGAGLYQESKVPRSCIRVDATGPEMDNAYIDPLAPDEEFDGGALSYRDDVPIGAKFGGAVDGESGISSYHIALGTTPYDSEDETEAAGQELFKLTPLSQGGDGNAEVQFNKINVAAERSKEDLLPGEILGNTKSALSYIDLVSDTIAPDFELKLQRGARHFFTLAAENAAGGKAHISSVPYTFLGPKENVKFIEPQTSSPITHDLSSQNTQLTSLSFARTERQCRGRVATSLLSEQEVQATYTGTNLRIGFTPYIQNPKEITLARASRYLRGRANPDTYMDSSMFVTALESGGTGCPLTIDVEHKPIVLADEDIEEQYALAFFDVKTDMWTEVAGSCRDDAYVASEFEDPENTTTSTTTTVRDSSYKLCDKANGKNNNLDSALHLAFFHLIGPIPNTPPSPEDAFVTTIENTKTEPIQLVSTDAELDEVTFALEESEFLTGSATLTKDGVFAFAPAFAYSGSLKIKYSVTEKLAPHLGLEELTSFAYITVEIKDAPSNPTIAAVNIDTNELMPEGAQFFAGYVNESVVFKVVMLDFEGEDISLVERGLPRHANVTSAKAGLEQARSFATQEWARRCFETNCTYPWSSFEASILTPSAFEISISMELTGDELQEVQMLAQDSSGAFSNVLRADIVACERGHWFNPLGDVGSLCTPFKVCIEGVEFLQPSNSILQDNTCIPVGAMNATETADLAIGKNGAGLAIGLVFLFLFTILFVGLMYRREMQKRAENSISAALMAQRAEQAANFVNPVYGGVQQKGFENPAYAGGMASGIKYAVPMEDDTVYGEEDVTYSIPMEETSFGDGGVTNPMYSIPMEAAGNDIYSLVPVAQPEGLYGVAGAEESVYAGISDTDLYGWIRGNDNASDISLPYLFTSKLNRAGAESIINTHGAAPGTFLVRVKGKTGFAITMQGVDGFEHHLLRANGADGGWTINGNELTGSPKTLDAAVASLSSKRGLVDVTCPLTAAVCIPSATQTASSVAPLWIHGTMDQATADKILTADGGSDSGLFMVYQRADGQQVLAVVVGAGDGGVSNPMYASPTATHMLVTMASGVYCLDGTVVPGADGWVSFRTALSTENSVLPNGTVLTKGVRRQQTPANLISADGRRPAWLHGAITRQQSKARLASCDNGSFLVRESAESPLEYKVSFVWDGKVQHQKVVVNPTTNKWNVKDSTVTGATLTAVVSTMQDMMVSELNYELTVGIENEPEYIVSLPQEVAGMGLIYSPAVSDAGNDTYITDLQLTATLSMGGEYMAVDELKKERPQTIFVQPRQKSVYASAGNDVYMDASELQAARATRASNRHTVYAPAKSGAKTLVVDTSGNPFIENNGEQLVSKASVHLASGSNGATYAIPTTEDASYAAPADINVTGANGAVYAVPTAGEAESTYAVVPSAGATNTLVANRGTIYAVPQEQQYDNSDGSVAVVANGNSLYAVPTEVLGAGAPAAAGGDVAVVSNFGKVYAIPTEKASDATYAVVANNDVEYAVPTDQQTASLTALLAAADGAAADGYLAVGKGKSEV